MDYLIKNATIVNEGKTFKGHLGVEGEKIFEIWKENELPETLNPTQVINAEGLLLIPGCIDNHVHFREPGLTHKGDIHSESRAAVAGGITSFMEMPNTNPHATTQKRIDDKFDIASRSSVANYSFIFGGANDNLEEIKNINPKNIPAIKLFLGCSTGNMLVDNEDTLDAIFKNSPVPILTHCEDQDTIQNNLEKYKAKYGDDIPIACHPKIRSEEACFISTSKTVERAKRTGARLHVVHLSTAKELSLFRNDIPLQEKQITAEACIHHLWFNDADYAEKGTKIKWNPAIKTEKDRQALFQAVLNDTIDVIATDHAPHTLQEKENNYVNAPSGGPLVQHSLIAMLEKHKEGIISIGKIVEKMAHNPAILFDIEKRGFLRKGYYADFILVDPNKSQQVKKENILYKCGWSPFEGTTFSSKVITTFINGHKVYDKDVFDENFCGKRLLFNR